MMGKTQNGEDGQVLPAHQVLNFTESLGTLSVAAHSGVKDVLLLESVKSPSTKAIEGSPESYCYNSRNCSDVATTSKELMLQAGPCPS